MTECKVAKSPITCRRRPRTVYENGAILQYTPDVLAKYRVCEATHRGNKIHPGRSDEYPLALGMKASASFPAAVPATTLGASCDGKNKPQKFLRLLDDGIADNLGAFTAMDLFAQDKAAPGKRRRVLLVVDAYNGNDQPYSKKEAAPAVIAVATRMMGISLDSWRRRHRHVVDALAGPEIKVIYLSFDELRDSDQNEAKVPLSKNTYRQDPVRRQT